MMAAVTPRPSAELVRLGTLEEVLNSQASPALKAACVEMGIEAAARRRKPLADDQQG
ncbi:hypothetical protein [Alteraurantiacibacter buctensis]|uniref:Uncharacterized protein n=1 Tax=Alteraurantiacibacter buctensis TaxID=1503981 RepID=A0A844Z3R8_9SPHN|nr:hypothetical protein [Alteraurantiacibacter buctensis]MXO72503.1 hypothetical protein [Alteraurantiacibacter buctensis]